MATEIVPTPTQLYRHFDKQGRLLYVGISLSALVRLGEHRTQSHWYRSIIRVEIETFPDRESAERAEFEAIRNECPLHNSTDDKHSRRRALEWLRVRLMDGPVPYATLEREMSAVGISPHSCERAAEKLGVEMVLPRNGQEGEMRWQLPAAVATAVAAVAAAEAAVDAAIATEGQRKTREAADWLRMQLAEGPLRAGGVIERGKVAGHSRRTLYRAAEDLGIKMGEKGGLWQLLPPS